MPFILLFSPKETLVRYGLLLRKGLPWAPVLPELLLLKVVWFLFCAWKMINFCSGPQLCAKVLEFTSSFVNKVMGIRNRNIIIVVLIYGTLVLGLLGMSQWMWIQCLINFELTRVFLTCYRILARLINEQNCIILFWDEMKIDLILLGIIVCVIFAGSRTN